jgi:hypothetical protein
VSKTEPQGAGASGNAQGPGHQDRRSGARLRGAGGYLVLVIAVLALAGAVFLLWGADRTGGGSGSDEPPVLAPGQPAPPFDLPAAGGDTVSLPADAGGRPVLLYFSMGPG